MGKRSRTEAGLDDYDDYLELMPPRKRVKVDRTSSTLLKSGEERKPIVRLRRSNSVDRLGERLSIQDRHTSSTGLKKEDFKDYSVIAVYSREAFESFGKKWKQKMNSDTLERATKSSRLGVDSKEVSKLLNLQSRHLVETDFEKQLQKLIENKTLPHMIAVIEGREEKESVSLSTKVDEKAIDVPYKRLKYLQGTSSKGGKDNKQSMSIYVRDDMKSVYRVSEVKVDHKSTKKKIKALAIDYATTDDTKYRTLVVHIPNEFIGTKSKEEDTHSSFQTYAEEQRKSSITVTSYFGDTNYSSPVNKFSSPSMGGHTTTGGFLNPQSSSAKKETHFMQSIGVSSKDKKHSVLQPSTLNSIFINSDKTIREATDHPSLIQYVAHDQPLKGRTSDIELLEMI